MCGYWDELQIQYINLLTKANTTQYYVHLQECVLTWSVWILSGTKWTPKKLQRSNAKTVWSVYSMRRTWHMTCKTVWTHVVILLNNIYIYIHMTCNLPEASNHPTGLLVGWISSKSRIRMTSSAPMLSAAKSCRASLVWRLIHLIFCGSLEEVPNSLATLSP